jgi:hypothetical protein
MCHVDTQNQLADILTKPLDQAAFARLRGELGVSIFLFRGGKLLVVVYYFWFSL